VICFSSLLSFVFGLPNEIPVVIPPSICLRPGRWSLFCSSRIDGFEFQDFSKPHGFLGFDALLKLSKGRLTLGARRWLELSSFVLMERFAFNSREIVQRVLARTAAWIKSFCFSRGTSASTSG
jgi:hypothetical protein